MGIRFGPIDPLQLIFEIINNLVKKGVMSLSEADEIVKSSLDPSLSEKEKQKILESLKGGSKNNKEEDGK